MCYSLLCLKYCCIIHVILLLSISSSGIKGVLYHCPVKLSVSHITPKCSCHHFPGRLLDPSLLPLEKLISSRMIYQHAFRFMFVLSFLSELSKISNLQVYGIAHGMEVLAANISAVSGMHIVEAESRMLQHFAVVCM